MAGDNNSEWLMRGSAAATIIYNDPVWSEQEYDMQRGERLRGHFDPPVPAHLIDVLRARWSETSALCNRMATEGCYARDHCIRWVPRALLADYQALITTPLPGSAGLKAA